MGGLGVCCVHVVVSVGMMGMHDRYQPPPDDTRPPSFERSAVQHIPISFHSCRHISFVALHCHRPAIRKADRSTGHKTHNYLEPKNQNEIKRVTHSETSPSNQTPFQRIAPVPRVTHVPRPRPHLRLRFPSGVYSVSTRMNDGVHRRRFVQCICVVNIRRKGWFMPVGCWRCGVNKGIERYFGCRLWGQ